jgi:small subunit ribosomal protein S1
MSADVTTPSSIEELAPRMELRGKVTRLELTGAFVDIGVGTDAFLHISQLNQSNVRNVSDVLKVDDEITVYVLKADANARRVALSMTQPPALTWEELKEGDSVNGKVVRIETFGVFVDIGAERPGMVHVSELSNGYVKSPSDVVKVGEEVEARVLKINRKKRQIDLTMKEPAPVVEVIEDDEEQEAVPTAMELALRRAMSQADDGPKADAKGGARKTRKATQEQEDIFSRTLRSQQK